jgi:hypothetical protein
MLFAIPPVLVAVTALACFPLIGASERVIEREREELGALPQLLPPARVVR